MIVTLEDLQKYDGCGPGIEWVKAHHMENHELIDFINHPDIPIHYLHYGRQYFRANGEELAAYFKRCNVDEQSRHIYGSTDIKCSSRVVDSNDVSESRMVRYSTHVDYSNYIYNSKDILHSNHVVGSEDVKDSNFIFDSQYVTMSENIVQCKAVDYAKLLMYCEDMMNCAYLVKSAHCEDCMFGNFLTDCKNCLFCSGLTEKEFYIFNTEVTAAQFYSVRAALDEFLATEDNNFVTVAPKDYTSNRYSYSMRFDSIYEGLTPNFYGWVGTIPQFNEDVFLNVFFKPIDNLQNFEN